MPAAGPVAEGGVSAKAGAAINEAARAAVAKRMRVFMMISS
jgi:hypothetical protein